MNNCKGAVPLDQYERSIINWGINVTKNLLMRVQRMKMNNLDLLPTDREIVLMKENLIKSEFLHEKRGSELLFDLEFGKGKFSEDLEQMLVFMKELAIRLALYLVPREPPRSSKVPDFWAAEAYLVDEKCLLRIKKFSDFYGTMMIPKDHPCYDRLRVILVLIDVYSNFDSYLSTKEMVTLWNLRMKTEGVELCARSAEDVQYEIEDPEVVEEGAQKMHVMIAEGPEQKKKVDDAKAPLNEENVKPNVTPGSLMTLKNNNTSLLDKDNNMIIQSGEVAAVVGVLVGQKEAAVAECLEKVGAFDKKTSTKKDGNKARGVSSPPDCRGCLSFNSQKKM